MRAGTMVAGWVALALGAGCKGNSEMTPGAVERAPAASAAPAKSLATPSPDPAEDGQKGAYQGGAVQPAHAGRFLRRGPRSQAAFA